MRSSELLQELVSHYEVGPTYAQAYLDYWTRPGGRYGDRRFGSVADILALPPPDSVWFDYALSTNQRGRDMCARLLALPEAPAAPQRFLDVGAGFGGLLAAFAKRGLEVVGIELDPQRVELARANCADHGLVDAVRQGDILDGGLIQELGTFDIITVIDVIEHVLDVPRALRHVTGLLNPGGILVLEIPNRHSLRFIEADGHFGLFGIALLDRPDAVAYHQTAFSFPYDVGDYYRLDHYRSWLDELGCSMRQFDTPVAPLAMADIPDRLRLIRAAFQRYRAEYRPRLSPLADARLQTRLAEYLSTFSREYRHALASGPSDAFRDTYLVDFWTVVARRRDGA